MIIIPLKPKRGRKADTKRPSGTAQRRAKPSVEESPLEPAYRPVKGQGTGAGKLPLKPAKPPKRSTSPISLNPSRTYKPTKKA